MRAHHGGVEHLHEVSRAAEACERLEEGLGVALRTIQRIWDAHRLQPHRVRSFKRPDDPAFAEKVENTVGLYMSPPAHAVVLSINEKS